MDEDEPLEQWAARRDAMRRPVGELKAVMLDGLAATHVRPTEPRLILCWDGVEWVPHTVADDYPTAQRILHGIKGDGMIPMPAPQPRKPAGRHRKPR
ncbi:hypothetical protein E6W39_09720 [Kitasatospora acidiphila]|uniref:Uncharacterized protein n=1 Tax=Kitasatospora acidiphila TaxID=2567942 RepID=A0A540W0G3_9ACTN|nr:DUF6087 family protein [Kitasatospora acidiphila]TQF02500.1 hypothetical protein E6W39_09720 [Kitasatospora acidiphila]